MTTTGRNWFAREVRTLVVRGQRRYRASPAAATVAVLLAVVLAAVGVVHWLPIDRPSAHTHPTLTPTQRPSSVVAPERFGAREVPIPTQDKADHAVSAVARRFATAWASADRAGIRATTTAPLGRRLDTAPAAPSTGSIWVAVTGVVVERVTDQRSAVALVTLQSNPATPGTADQRSADTKRRVPPLNLALTLTRTANGWRVAGIGAT